MPVDLTPLLFTLKEILLASEDAVIVAALFPSHICVPFPESPNLTLAAPLLS